MADDLIVSINELFILVLIKIDANSLDAACGGFCIAESISQGKNAKPLPEFEQPSFQPPRGLRS